MEWSIRRRLRKDRLLVALLLGAVLVPHYNTLFIQWPAQKGEQANGPLE